MKIRIALFVSSLALTIVVASVILTATDEDWREYQSAYYDAALGQASSETVKAAIRESGLEIKQDMLTGFGADKRADRCRTCHMAVDDPNFADGTEPLRTHPDVKGHSFNEFGCTICHEGQGRALDKFHAHGEDKHWPEPILAAPYIEASCARCHPDPYLDETPHLRRGRQLFEKYACVGCHKMQGISRGTLGPDLSDIGKRYRIDYLRESIEDPAANMAMTIMPAYRMPEQDLIDLVVFLKSRRGKTIFEDPITLRTKTRKWKKQQPEPHEVTVEDGKKSFEKRACVACHKMGMKDGGLGPDLTFAGLIRDADYMEAHLADPRSHTPDSNMPNFWMHETERKAIAKYLASLTDYRAPLKPEEQYMELCARCHGERGDGNGPAAGNLVPRPREFTNAKFFNWLPDERGWAAIHRGVPGTAMPAFREMLSEAQSKALFDWIREHFLKAKRTERRKPRKLPTENPIAWSSESMERGRIIYQKRCYGCHGRFADGRGPNASEMLPRPRNLKNTAYMNNVSDIRLWESITHGIVGTGMPPWEYLPDSQRWDLVNFVRGISKTGAAAKGSDR